jgi:hypothetical protein
VRCAVWLAGGALPGVTLLLAYDMLVFGSPLRSGYVVYDPALTFAGGASVLRLLARNLPWYLKDLNSSVWGWPWGDLLLPVVLVWRRAQWKYDLLLALTVSALVAAYAAYHVYDVNHHGPRYAFEALGVLSLLVARAVFAAGGVLSTLARRVGAARLHIPGVLVLAAILAFPLLVRLPPLARAYAHAYHGHTDAPLRRMSAAGVGDDALILVSGTIAKFNYGSFFLHNALDPVKGRRIYVLDLPERREKLIAGLPRREVWRVFVDLRPLIDSDPRIDNTWELREVVWTRIR